jgi:putative peptidoglycan lipid II flippase
MSSDKNGKPEHDPKRVPDQLDHASEIAGETDLPVGAIAGETRPEQATKKIEARGGTGRHAFLVGAGILISRIIGLVRQRIFGYYFGLSAAGDAFSVAFRIPNFLQNVFGEGALSASLIPVYARLLAEKKIKDATEVANAVFTLLTLTTALLVLAGVLLSPYLISVIAFGYTGEKRELTLNLVKIFFPGAGLLVMSAWCLGILNSHRRFFLSYTAPVVWNVAIIAALIFFGRRTGGSLDRLAEYTAWGSVAGSFLQFAIQLPTVVRSMGIIKPVFAFASESVKTVVRNFFPVFFSRGVVQISAFVDATLATLLGDGPAAALQYTQSLYTLPVSLFGMSVSAAELPAMSSAVGSTEEVASELRKRLNAGLKQIAVFIIPSSMGFLAFGDVMVGALYRTGKFGQNDVRFVWGTLAGAAVGLLASTLGRLYSSTYYALKDTKSPLKFAAIRVFLTIVLGYLFSVYVPPLLGIPIRWGAVGLTASAGLAGWVEFVLLRRKLNQRIGATGLPFSFVTKLWGAAILAAALGWGVKLGLARVYPLHPIPAAAVILGPYGVAYFLLAAGLGVTEARAVMTKFFRKIPGLGR